MLDARVASGRGAPECGSRSIADRVEAALVVVEPQMRLDRGGEVLGGRNQDAGDAWNGAASSSAS